VDHEEAAMKRKCGLLWLALPAFVSASIGTSGYSKEPAAEASRPTVKQGPLCSVQREIYVNPPEPGAATSVKRVTYLGGGLRRREFLMTTRRSDIADAVKVRYSEDNGRTWSEPVNLSATEDREQNGVHLDEVVNATKYDPVAKRTVEMVYQRIYLGEVEPLMKKGWAGSGKKFFDHGFYRLSDDDGRTWSERRLLTFEPGAPFDPKNWADPDYLKHNEVSGSYDAYTLSDGRIVYPVVTPVAYEEDDEDRRVCRKIPWFDSERGFVRGVMCIFGTWNPAKKDYDWTHSKPIWVPRRVSTRGLAEPVLAEFVDGTLMLDMRGSNTRLNPRLYPGRRWISLSKDRGKTWSDVRDLRYDTGEQFYSPASHSRVVRSGKTGALYWIGNISSTPPSGNGPRYPLYIAEVDETNAALKKNTLTVIDDSGPTDTDGLQISNFSLLENRETKDLELFLTRYGEQPGSIYNANAYRYTLKLVGK
jgi:BNR repeat-like domain